jgi:hypothetical protein
MLYLHHFDYKLFWIQIQKHLSRTAVENNLIENKTKEICRAKNICEDNNKM